MCFAKGRVADHEMLDFIWSRFNSIELIETRRLVLRGGAFRQYRILRPEPRLSGAWAATAAAEAPAGPIAAHFEADSATSAARAAKAGT